MCIDIYRKKFNFFRESRIFPVHRIIETKKIYKILYIYLFIIIYFVDFYRNNNET